MTSRRELWKQVADALALGSESHRNGEYGPAVRAYTLALQLSGQHHVPIAHDDLLMLHTKRGICFSFMRQFPEAVEDLTEAIGLLPDWDELHYNRGVCYMELGEFESTGSHPGEQ